MIKKIVFFQKQAFPYMGVMSIAGYIRGKLPKIEMAAVIYNLEKESITRIKAHNPDLIAVSSVSTEHRWLKYIIPLLKNNFKVPIVLGGIHASLYYQECLETIEGLDYVCVGDGEYFLKNFIDFFGSSGFKDISGLAYKSNNRLILNHPKKLFDSFEEAIEDREVYYDSYPEMAKDFMKQFISTRGCLANCKYCYNSIYRKKLRELISQPHNYVRKKPVKVLIEEIKNLVSKYPTKSIFIADDNFLINENWVKEFSYMYKKEIALPYMAVVCSEYVNENKVRYLKNSKCRFIEIGLEISDEEISIKTLGRPVRNDKIINAIKLLHKYNIGVVTANMHLIPGANLDNFMANVDFNIKNKVEQPKATIFMPFPQTEVETLCLDRGYLNNKIKFESLPESFYFKSILQMPNKQRLIRLHKVFYWMVKIPFLKNFLNLMSTFKIPIIFDLLFIASIFVSYKAERGLSTVSAIKLFWRFRRSR